MPDSRTNLSPFSELAIGLDRNCGDPLHRQIEASIRQRIRSGAMPAGVALPPTRALAAELGVTRGVVVEAYAQGLVAEGYLNSRAAATAGGTRAGRRTASRHTGAWAAGSVAPASRSASPGPAASRSASPGPAAPRSASPGPAAPRSASPGPAAPRSASPAPPPRALPARPRRPRPMVDFGYGRGNVAAFPRTAWLRSVRRVLTEAPDDGKHPEYGDQRSQGHSNRQAAGGANL